MSAPKVGDTVMVTVQPYRRAAWTSAVVLDAIGPSWVAVIRDGRREVISKQALRRIEAP